LEGDDDGLGPFFFPLFFPFHFSGVVYWPFLFFHFPFRPPGSGWLYQVGWEGFAFTYTCIYMSTSRFHELAGWESGINLLQMGFFLLFCFLTLTLTLTKVIHRLSCVIMV